MIRINNSLKGFIINNDLWLLLIHSIKFNFEISRNFVFRFLQMPITRSKIRLQPHRSYSNNPSTTTCKNRPNYSYHWVAGVVSIYTTYIKLEVVSAILIFIKRQFPKTDLCDNLGRYMWVKLQIQIIANHIDLVHIKSKHCQFYRQYIANMSKHVCPVLNKQTISVSISH